MVLLKPKRKLFKIVLASVLLIQLNAPHPYAPKMFSLSVLVLSNLSDFSMYTLFSGKSIWLLLVDFREINVVTMG